MPQPAPPERTRLADLCAVFLKLGTTAFGGPAVHVAMMEDEVVRRRRWLTRDQFLDYLGAANLIPGPNSTELAIHIGHSKAGWPGLLIAGISFILPAALIVAGIAWTYRQFGSLPAAAGILYGVKPVVMAIVVQALWRLGRAAIKRPSLAALAGAAAIASAIGVHELLILGLGGLGMALPRILRRTHVLSAAVLFSLAACIASATAVYGQTSQSLQTPFTLRALFLVFAKAGSILFGSGYVLLAYLRADLVTRLHWLTEAQLLDAVAVGQVTPGPVFTTATFIGYVLAGPAGAAVATIAIFLPAFVFVAVSGPLIPRLRRSPTAGAVLDGVNAASLALMAVVSWTLARAAIVDVPAAMLALVSLILLLRWNPNSVWLIGAGAALGLLVR